MRVKRYVVDSMPEALQRIRTDLGKNAIILDTKPIRTGGLFGLFGKRRIEVIAADDEADRPAPAPAVPTPAGAAAPAAGLSGRGSAASVPGAPAVPRAASAAAAPSAAVRGTAASAADFLQAAARSIPDAAVRLEAGDGPAIRARSSVQPPSDDSRNELLMREMRQLKEMLARLAAPAPAGATGPWPAAFLPVERRLMEQDVLPEVIRAVFERALDERDGAAGEWTVREAAGSVRQILTEMLRPVKPRTIRPETKIVHFVGPTGVGKTTTIAKLAAEQVLRHGRKIGFITADTYRIAAVEQLRTYADILNVPLEVVFSPLEMAKAFRALEDRDLIFMDTAGRNYRNEMMVSELNALLRASDNSETILVLSLSSKYRDMKTVVDSFSRIDLDDVLYTKLDETDTYGSIINLAHEYGFRGTYVSDGQNVPDDIAELDEKRIVDLIMGGVGDA